MEEEHLKRVLHYDKNIMIDSCHIMIDSCHITAACGTDMVKVDMCWVDWHWFIVLLTPDLLCFVFFYYTFIKNILRCIVGKIIQAVMS